MLLFSPAKVNLHLQAIKKRDDGFHELQSIFHTVDCFDKITLFPITAKKSTFSLARSSKIAASSAHYDLIQDHLFFQIFADMRKQWSLPFGAVSIELEKNIPIGAGLGGGSSNIAAFMLGIYALGCGNQSRPRCFEQIPREDQKKLLRLAVVYGSDVPFFFYGGLAAVGGRGEKIAPLPFSLRFPVLICYPNCHISTPQAYKSTLTVGKNEENQRWFCDLWETLRKIGAEGSSKKTRIKEFPLLSQRLLAFLQAGNDRLEKGALVCDKPGAVNCFWKKTKNNKAEVAKMFAAVQYWRIKKGKKTLIHGLSGSGSSLFWVFHDKINAVSNVYFGEEGHGDRATGVGELRHAEFSDGLRDEACDAGWCLPLLDNRPFFHYGRLSRHAVFISQA